MPGGRFDFSFVAQVVTSKIRTTCLCIGSRTFWLAAGPELSRSTLCQIMASAGTVGLAAGELHDQAALGGQLIGSADDTPSRLLDGTHPQGVQLTPVLPVVPRIREASTTCFTFTRAVARDGPSEFLRDFRGMVKVDAYGVSDGVYA